MQGLTKGSMLSVSILPLALALSLLVPFQHPTRHFQLATLFGPAPAYGQTCITYVYDVVVSETACNWNDCHGDVWVHVIEDGVEVSFQDANILGEPSQQQLCYSVYDCDPADSPRCGDPDPENKPCYSVACRDYMMECGEIRTIQWWNGTYAPAHRPGDRGV